MKMKFLLSFLALCVLLPAAHADLEQTVNDLIPKMAADPPEARYEPQIELQNLAVRAARPGAESERAALAKILAAKAADPAVPQASRVWIVRQLQHIGAAESVPTLASLLNSSDAELRECARRALEKNRAPGASAPLRSALEKGGPPAWRIGLINSLAERQDRGAIDLIAAQLQDPSTAEAAAMALGMMPTAESVQTLWEAFGKNPAAGSALVDAANRLAAADHRDRAHAIFAKLSAPQNPVPIRAAVLAGLARTDGAKAGGALVEALSSNEPRLRQAAIQAAPDVYGKSASAKLATVLPQLPAPAKVLVLAELDHREQKAVIAATNDADPDVRQAALQALGRMGGPGAVPVLVAAAAGQAKAEKEAAAEALTRISGDGSEAELERMAAKGDSALRCAAITALAGRDQQQTLPRLLDYAADSDPAVSKAAYAALRQMGTAAQLQPLAKLALESDQPEAMAALKEVAGRSENKEAAAKTLLTTASNADARGKGALCETLAVLGGDQALAFVTQQTSAQDPELQSAAVRALGNWSDFSAMEPLTRIAADPNAKLSHHVLALRGIARLVQSEDQVPAAARIDAALGGLKAAKRAEEKKLLLSALATVPDRRAADAITPYLQDPKVKDDAAVAGLNLAEKLVRADRKTAQALARQIRDANVSDDLNRRADRILRR